MDVIRPKPMLKLAKAWQSLSIVVAVVLLLEGLLLILITGPATIQGYGEVSEGDTKMFGLLLLAIGASVFAFGLLSVLKPRMFDRGSRALITSNLVKVFGGVAVVAEGIVLAMMAGKVTIEGFGTYPTYIVAAFAGQVFLLGLSLILLTMLSSTEFRVSRLLTYLGGLVAASEGVIIIGIAQETFIQGLGGILERTVLYAGVQLLALGLFFLICCLMVDVIGRWRSVFSALRLFSGSLIIIEGLAITAMATNVTPADIGTLTTRTLTIAGIQLALFMGIALFMTGGRRVSLASPRWSKLSTMAAIALMLLLPAALLTVGKFW